jgi:hypothetical protein
MLQCPLPSVRRADRQRAVVLAALAAGALALAGCGRPPVAWDDSRERRAALPPGPAGIPDSATADRALVGAVREAAGASADSALAAAVPPLPDLRGRACEGSVRLADGRDGERYAAWWSVGPQGTVTLVAARSADAGATWTPPVPVDTVDVGTLGCARPAPALAVDRQNGFVHLAYSLRGPEGGGVFYAHRMDPRAPFEPPQVIVYGTERPVAVSVASQGDTVVVAYEDPNVADRPAVSMALSRTGGHTFEERVVVSGGGASAQRPAVALRGPTLAIGWLTRPNAINENITPTAPTSLHVRIGSLQ